MSELARNGRDDGPRSAPAPTPPLEVVRDTPTPEPTPLSTDRDEPNLGRSAVRGYVIGFLVTTVAITVTGTLGGLGFGPSLGLGAFVGVWGGGGFGFMMGGTLPLARYLDGESTHSAHHQQGDTP